MRKIKEFIQENYMFLLFGLLLISILTYPLPYYIYEGGGLLNIDDRVSVSDKTKSLGSYNLCYVKQVQATIPSYLLSYVFGWDIVSKDVVAINKKETDKEINIRDKIYLEQANSNAIISAFRSSDVSYKILDTNPVVLAISDSSVTDLEIGDEILSIDNTNIDTNIKLQEYIKSREYDDILNIRVINNNKEYERHAKIVKIDNEKKVGLYLEDIVSYDISRDVKFNFKNNEGGPSGGFMLSLALYDYLISDDLTNGLKIAGTGTIDIDGNVGSIGGVKYKLKGAVDSKSDIFFVPSGENYKEAIKEKEKHGYKIDIVSVSRLDDAIKYLEDIKK